MRTNRSSNNVDHEPRRNDYYSSNYHHSSRSSQNHIESNGYGSGNSSNNEYRSSKRPSSSVTSASPSSSLIKRMKSSPNSTHSINSNNVGSTRETNNRDIHSGKSSSSKSSSSSSSINVVDPNECHTTSFNGCNSEESLALEGENLVENAQDAFDQFNETTQNLRKLVSELLESKKKAQNKKHDNADKKEQVFNNFKMQGLMQLMEMRRLNRIDKYRLKEARQRFNTSKEKVDKIHLQLQNLQYEVVHLQKEQKTCASFRSKDERLELVDCSKFYLSDSVPDNLQHLVVLSKDKTSASISESISNEERHMLHLARLDWEMKQRISFEDDLKLAEESRFRLEVEISAKRRTLTQFDPTLRNVIEASKPLISQLNVPLQVYSTGNALTPYLPQPLYVLYIQLCAYRGAFGINCEVNIIGTSEEAQEYESLLKKESDGHFFNNNDEDDDSNKLQDEDDEDSGHRSKSKTRHQHQSAYDIAYNNLSNGDMDKMDNILDSSEKNDFARKHSRLLQSHPLKVKLMFRYRHYQMGVTFNFYSKLELIGVNYSVENLSNSAIVDSAFSVTNYESNLFSKLLSSSDTGCKSPNLAVGHILKRNDIDSFDKLLPYIGYTYDWAQRMAGIEFLHPDQRPMVTSSIIRVKSSIAIDSLDQTIKAINSRFQARINLQEQINEIHSKKCIDTHKFESLLDANEIYDDLDKVEPKSSIISLERLNSESFLDEIDHYPSRKRQLVDYFDYESSEDSELSRDIFDQNNFIFKLVITSEDEGYLLNATIMVPHSYPQKWPFFILNRDAMVSTLEHSYLETNWIKTLEEHVNVRLPLKVYQQAKELEEAIYPTTLLLRQTYDLLRGLDVIAGARKQLTNKSGQSMEVYSGPKSVNSFSSMSVVEGRDHSLKIL